MEIKRFGVQPNRTRTDLEGQLAPNCGSHVDPPKKRSNRISQLDTRELACAVQPNLLGRSRLVDIKFRLRGFEPRELGAQNVAGPKVGNGDPISTKPSVLGSIYVDKIKTQVKW